MRLYGLASYEIDQLIEWYGRREDAEEALRAVLEGEPECEPVIGIRKSGRP